MPTKPIDSKVAREHLRDGEDILVDCTKNLRRVIKNFPELQPKLQQAADHIDAAKAKIGEAKQQLTQAK